MGTDGRGLTEKTHRVDGRRNWRTGLGQSICDAAYVIFCIKEGDEEPGESNKFRNP